ncbi:uncharacterized protein TNCV_1974451 [Trichonephila clavipes]|nr:uncharacterized protein TNCV_1974451 [Trichonephila clavipes]
MLSCELTNDHWEDITELCPISICGYQECYEEYVETCMEHDADDCAFQMLNQDEIVTSKLEEFDHVDNELDEDEGNNNNESSKAPSNADVFSALETNK